MKNIETLAQQEVTTRLVVNGSKVTLKFAPASNDQVLKKAKGMLAASFSQSVIKDGTPHIENRIMTQP